MTRAGRWWTGYVIGLASLVATMSWISVHMLALENDERHARADANREQLISDALWYLDSWMTPLLAREASRDPAEYTAYLNPTNPLAVDIRTNTQSLAPMQQRVLTPSPLLNFDSQYFQLHFSFVPPVPRTAAPKADPRRADDEPAKRPAITVCSPQLPVDANQRDHCRFNGLLTDEDLASNAIRVERTEALLNNTPHLLEKFGRGESYASRVLDTVSENRATSSSNAQLSMSAEDNNYVQWARRAQTMSTASQSQMAEPRNPVAPVFPSNGQRIGPLIPLWVPASNADGLELLFMRRVSRAPAKAGTTSTNPDDCEYQGFLIDWPRLRAELTGQVEDLVPGARLEPVPEIQTGDNQRAGDMLATLPVRLELADRPSELPSEWTPAEAGLALSWIVLLFAMGATAMGLTSMLKYGDKRTRFASAVTHELRTPLTTFQLYSEMLADGMITDAAKRREYLETLRSESLRLSNLVENVMCYARLEDGRRRRRDHDATMTIGELLRQILPDSRRRCEESQMDLVVTTPGDEDRLLRTDAGAVGQILLNLIDNACKYAGDIDPRVELAIRVDGGRLRIDVHDHGPGIPQDARKTIFEPFERAGRESSNLAGIGLGLALSRGLAQDLGGSLELIDGSANPEAGAHFRFEVAAD